jgi:DNA-directed RNA polymerase subunit E'/Rpb7
MQTIVIEKRVSLESKYLDSNIIDHLIDKLKKLTSEKCTKEHGYILEIERVIEISECEIGRNDTDNIFTVKFQATILKPEKGTTMTGNVCMIYKDGVFISIMEKQKMLIPKSKLTDYTFVESSNIYTHKKNGKNINIGDKITCVVSASAYNNQSYSCFGSIV